MEILRDNMNKSQLILGDCIEHLADIPKKSVDLIITDLPYGVLNKQNKNAQWDKPITLNDLWVEYRRITKPNSPIILFGQGMFTAELMLSQPKLWRYNLIWEKDRPTGFLNANRMPLRSHEDICIFYAKLPVYHPQMIPCLPEERNHPIGNGKHKDLNQHYGKYARVPQDIPDVKFPRSILKIPKEHKCDGKAHPTQKPIELCEWLIKTYSDKGDTVLDSCMGSGSTGVAALRTHRKFIGIEINPEYYELAVNNINSIKNFEG